MLEKIVQLDKQALVYLNGLGSEQWDPIWLVITKQLYWAPFFLFVFYWYKRKSAGKILAITCCLLLFWC